MNRLNLAIPILATLIRVLWLLLEYPYLRRNRVTPAKDWDKHSGRFWDVANAVEVIGMIAGFMGVMRIQTGANVIMPLAAYSVSRRNITEICGHPRAWEVLYGNRAHQSRSPTSANRYL
jgi:hypothetical protein